MDALPGTRAPREVTFSDLLSVLVRYRFYILAAGIGGALFAVADMLRAPDRWSSSATIIPPRQVAQTGQGQGIGWGAPAADIAHSPDFYIQLVRSRVILGQVVDSARITLPSGLVTSIYEALDIRDENPRHRRESAMGAVSNMVSASADDKTRIMKLTVEAPSPDVAVGLARAFLAALVRFNGEVRQSGAAAEREFIDRRRAEIRVELSAAEDRLKAFLRQNRGGQSPDLQFEQQRLESEVTLRRELYLALSQAYERARIEAVRDTPILSVIDEPERPLGPDPKPGASGMVLGFFGGLVFGVVLVFVIESVRLARAATRNARLAA